MPWGPFRPWFRSGPHGGARRLVAAPRGLPGVPASGGLSALQPQGARMLRPYPPSGPGPGSGVLRIDENLLLALGPPNPLVGGLGRGRPSPRPARVKPRCVVPEP
eukprot:15438466-Alexandrium_andersonii.AAC.1